jgi:endonuclease/exonuclease/phosphatase family metal-dependent hydrolase
MRRRVRLVTWNVLHRIHAVNWEEGPVRAFPDERERIARIAERVAAMMSSQADAVALQEVSGDQLAAIRAAVSPDVLVLEHTYPRVPRLRDGSAPPLDDPTEHLVVLARGPAAIRGARTFGSDPGKGYLATELDGLLLVCTHVSAFERGPAQLAEIASATTAPAVVLGDFNAPAAAVRAGFGAPFVVSEVSEPTRVATAEHPAKVIDHVAVRGGTLASAVVEDGAGLSDHVPVRAEVRFD